MSASSKPVRPVVTLAVFLALSLGASRGVPAQEPERAQERDGASGAGRQDPSVTGGGGEEIPIPADRRGREFREVTLEDCLRLGLRNNVDLQAANVVPEQALLDRVTAEALYEPELYAEAGVARSSSPSRNVFSPSIQRETVDGLVGWRQRVITGGLFDVSFTPSKVRQTSSIAGFPERQYSSELRGEYTQPLLRGGWADYGLAEIEIARSRAAAATHTLERTVQDTLLAIVQAYWELVFARENYRVVAQALGVADEQLRITLERIRVRDLAERDRIADEAEVARRREELIRAEAEIDQREDDLRRLLLPGTDDGMWGVNLRPVTPYEIEPEPMNQAEWRRFADQAMQHRADLRNLRAERTAAEKELLRADRDLWPQLDLTGAYSTDGVQTNFPDAWGDTTDLAFPDWSLRLTFAMPIGNSAARAGVRRSELGLERAIRLLRAAELDVAQEVRAAVRDLATLVEAIRAARESLRLAETNLETEQIKLRVGSTTTFEVQRRNQELREARSRLLRNLLDYRIALKNLDYATGVLRAPGDELEDPPEAESMGAGGELRDEGRESP